MSENETSELGDALDDVAPDTAGREYEAREGMFPGAPHAPVRMGPQPAHKQLYQFLWGSIAVLFGCLLPFHSYAEGWDKSVYNPELQGPIGIHTVGGSIVAFTSMLVIGAQLFCMKFRRVMLGPIVLQMFVCCWAWFRVVPGLGCTNLSLTEEGEARSWTAIFYNGETFTNFWNHVGPGLLFALCGSTYVVLVFFGALLGLGKKKDEDGEVPKARGRGRRR